MHLPGPTGWHGARPCHELHVFSPDHVARNIKANGTCCRRYYFKLAIRRRMRMPQGRISRNINGNTRNGPRKFAVTELITSLIGTGLDYIT